MKKTLLLAGLLMGSLFTVNAQTLSYDFNALSVGNVGTDITGATAGQGGWYTNPTNGTAPTTTTNASNASFQIVANAAPHGNVLQMTGPNGNLGGNFMWQNGGATWWAARTSGNNIIEVEYDFYTGAATTSLNTMRLAIYDETYNKVLAGISVAMNTRIVSGLAYYTSGSNSGNYTFGLGANASSPIVLAANTWVRLSFSYNYTTGAVKFKGPGFNGGIAGTAPTTVPYELDIVALSGSLYTGTNITTPNTVAGVGLVDNITVKATNVDSLLGTEKFAPVSEFIIAPNPVSDVLTISNSNNALIDAIQITDLNGRVVKSIKVNGASNTQVNVSDLSAGIYMMNIASEQGTAVKKIIKK